MKIIEILRCSSLALKSKTEKKIVPNFLIDLDKEELNNINLLDGLKLVGDYLEKSILIPNNISLPSAIS